MVLAIMTEIVVVVINICTVQNVQNCFCISLLQKTKKKKKKKKKCFSTCIHGLHEIGIVGGGVKLAYRPVSSILYILCIYAKMCQNTVVVVLLQYKISVVQ